MNDEPPPMVVKAEVVDTDVTAKSEGMPVVPLTLSDTVMVQDIVIPTRDGLVLVHANVDDVVGLP